MSSNRSSSNIRPGSSDKHYSYRRPLNSSSDKHHSYRRPLKMPVSNKMPESSSKSETRNESQLTQRMAEEQICKLLSKLKHLASLQDHSSCDASNSKELEEICNQVRNLHTEVDDLNERLSWLLSSIDDQDCQQAVIIKGLLSDKNKNN